MLSAAEIGKLYTLEEWFGTFGGLLRPECNGERWWTREIYRDEEDELICWDAIIAIGKFGMCLFIPIMMLSGSSNADYDYLS